MMYSKAPLKIVEKVKLSLEAVEALALQPQLCSFTMAHCAERNGVVQKLPFSLHSGNLCNCTIFLAPEHGMALL